MKNLSFIQRGLTMIAVSFLLGTLVSPALALAFDAPSYQPLAPIPGTTAGDCDPNNRESEGCRADLENYIPGIIRLLIQIAGVLAVIMIVIGGIQYLSTDAISGKSEGKGRIQNAVYGLLLVFASFIILQTINPKTLDLNLSFAPISPIASEATPTTCVIRTMTPIASTGSVKDRDETVLCSDVPEDMPTCKVVERPGTDQILGEIDGCLVPLETSTGETETDAPPSNSPTAVNGTCNLPGGGTENCTCDPCTSDMTAAFGVPLKSGANASVYTPLGEKLQKLYVATKGWQVTEGFPPNYTHQSSCHRNGTCVDANFVPAITEAQLANPTQETVDKINRFFAGAKEVKARAEFEVSSAATVTALRNAGVSQAYTIKPITKITAPHFSIYNN